MKSFRSIQRLKPSIRYSRDKQIVMQLRSEFFILWFSVVFLFSGFQCFAEENNTPPLPVDGILDLTQWNFKEYGSVETNGYWEFYYGDFLSSSAFDTISEKRFAWVPGVWKRGSVSKDKNATISRKEPSGIGEMHPWNNHYWKGKKLGATGYASYRLTVILPRDHQNTGIRTGSVGTAFALMINDSLMAGSGTVGRSKEQSVPRFSSRLVVLNQQADTLRMVVWVSNFHYRKGGLWNPLVIGDVGHIENTFRNRTYYSVFITGIWFMVSFTLFTFFLYRPRNSVVLFLFLWAIASIIRVLSADERLILVFIPEINFDWLIRADIVSGYAMLPFAILALKQLFPAEFPKWFSNLSLILFLLLFLFVLITKPLIFTNLVVPYQVINLITLAFTLWYLFRTILHRRDNSRIVSVAFLFITFIYVVQILLYNQLKSYHFGYNIMTVGFFFAFAQILLLAKLFSTALKKAENFTNELENTVRETTEKLLKTQEELIRVARQTETEKVRRRISQDIHDDISSGLNKITWMSELVKVKATRNKPEEFSQTLDKIISASRETVDNLVEIIWSLNPRNDDLDNMLAYMRNYATRFFEDTPMNLTIQFPEPVEKRELNPELRRNLFLVMKESLNNASKYSGARNIVLNFWNEGIKYRLSVFDDGIGIEEGLIQGSGYGMINMQKRMEEISGRFIVETAPGKGTRIVLEGTLF